VSTRRSQSTCRLRRTDWRRSPRTSPSSRLSQPNRADLLVLKGLIEGGKIAPVMDREYPLADVPAAMRYAEQGHARGKVVVTVA
jgi:NADPH:quinone reductase-like Zn-dependent oxidoreductase